MADTRVMDLPDGRALCWIELGDPDGAPVFGFHGTPGSRRQMVVNQTAALAARVRFVCPDRPGYGLSTYQPERALADWAGDISALADRLGVDRFSVVGYSGGGPHAAACACLLPDRVHAAGLVSSVGLLGEPGAEDGMLGFNRLMTRAARKTPLTVLPFYTLMTAGARRWPERVMESFRRQLPAADAAVLGRPDVRAAFVDDLRHASRTTARAAIQDFALFAHDWGFRLQDIQVPVHVWQGDKDRNVPPAQGKLLAQRIPGATFYECCGDGHMFIIDGIGEVLAAVKAP